MWEISPSQVMHLRSPGGDRFTEFLDALIRAQAHISSIPASEIITNQRTNISDGGVDTEVRLAARRDPTGYMSNHPTVWQYKARRHTDVRSDDLRAEVRKSYALDRMRNGYAYRFCICDSLPAKKVKKWESLLTDEIRLIAPSAPDARVLTADNIASWASTIPGVALRLLPGEVATICLHIQAWEKNITAVTPVFVPVEVWGHVSDRLRQHVDFSVDPTEVELAISGEAGVGKTRLAYESLTSLQNAVPLVIYTSDGESALKVGHLLANRGEVHGILVADECSISCKVDLRRLLIGARERVRVVCIDSSQTQPFGLAPMSRLERIPGETVQEVLRTNFPEVPAERRRIYAGLSGGFVRLAADLCQHDGLISAAGHVGPALATVQDYLQRRFGATPEDMDALLALSLLGTVGTKEDVATQLEALCALTGLERSRILRSADRLHDGPGFVGRGGRFLYVTPEIVAQAAFGMAWGVWAKDPGEFLARVPQAILESFINRVARSASEEVRQLVSEFFRNWALALQPNDLTSLSEVQRLVVLLELHPETYLPILDRLVAESSIEQLREVEGHWVTGGWGPRRLLVFAMERLALFPELFWSTERVLLRLALAESEQQIENNATGVWTQFFRVLLSGTSVPFAERLRLLGDRLRASDTGVSLLALEALDRVFRWNRWGHARPPIVGGCIVPEEWRPATDQEYLECMREALSMVRRLVGEGDDTFQLRQGVTTTVLRHSKSLLDEGLLRDLKLMFSQEFLNDDSRATLIRALEDFLFFSAKRDGTVAGPYIREAAEWLDALRPDNFHGRLVSLIGVDRWHHATIGNEESWLAGVAAVAEECVRSPGLFEREEEWLFSPSAQSALVLGQELGRLDASARLLDFLLRSSVAHDSTELGRGYITSLLQTFPIHSASVNTFIDQITDDWPVIAFELSTAGGDRTAALQRALKLVASGRIAPACLQRFVFYVGSRNITLDEVEQVLLLLASIVERSGEQSAAGTAMQFLGHRSSTPAVWQHTGIRELTWRLLELAADTDWWPVVIRALMQSEPERAIRTAVSSIAPAGSGGYANEKNSIKVLSSLASEYPCEVMSALGEVILDEERGMQFYFGSYRSLVAALPPEVPIEWIGEHGVEAARRLARHLPVPRVGPGDGLVVPQLTEYVLRRFEGDARVFEEFCAGVHSFQWYEGDIAGRHESEARVAERFLNHPLKRIRDWAQYEIQSARLQAAQWRQMDEEFQLQHR